MESIADAKLLSFLSFRPKRKQRVTYDDSGNWRSMNDRRDPKPRRIDRHSPVAHPQRRECPPPPLARQLTSSKKLGVESDARGSKSGGVPKVQPRRPGSHEPSYEWLQPQNKDWMKQARAVNSILFASMDRQLCRSSGAHREIDHSELHHWLRGPSKHD